MKFLAVFLFISFSLLGLPVPANANDFGLVGGNRAFSLNVTSFKAQRFLDVIPQKYDYSCGSAALATLLKYHYQVPVSEQEVLDAMYAVGDQEKIRTQGFSLLDMRRYLATLGFRADGFQLDLNKIKDAGIPGIVLVNTNGYMHFVVLKGLDEHHVIIGDPALGTRKLTHGEFNKIWNNVFFVIRNHTSRARMSFDHKDGWLDRRENLVRHAISNQALSALSLHTIVAPGIYY